MTKYYVEKNNKIILYDTDLEKLKNTLKFIPQDGNDLEIKNTENEIVSLSDEEGKIIGFEIITPDEFIVRQQEEERSRINSLKITKRVFALALKELGITYLQLKELIASNEQAQLEWDLCVELERSNPLLDVMAAQIGITSEQLDCIFQKANEKK